MTTKIEGDDIAQHYICIDESAGRLVYSYFNDTLSAEAARSFEEHLLLCFRCQEILFTLDDIFDALKTNTEELFGLEESSKKKER